MGRLVCSHAFHVRDQQLVVENAQRANGRSILKDFQQIARLQRATENQLRIFRDSIKKAQQLQYDTIIEQLEKMEKLLKEQEL